MEFDFVLIGLMIRNRFGRAVFTVASLEYCKPDGRVSIASHLTKPNQTKIDVYVLLGVRGSERHL